MQEFLNTIGGTKMKKILFFCALISGSLPAYSSEIFINPGASVTLSPDVETTVTCRTLRDEPNPTRAVVMINAPLYTNSNDCSGILPTGQRAAVEVPISIIKTFDCTFGRFVFGQNLNAGRGDPLYVTHRYEDIIPTSEIIQLSKSLSPVYSK
jgi:hypothetical protein